MPCTLQREIKLYQIGCAIGKFLNHFITTFVLFICFVFLTIKITFNLVNKFQVVFGNPLLKLTANLDRLNGILGNITKIFAIIFILRSLDFIGTLIAKIGFLYASLQNSFTNSLNNGSQSKLHASIVLGGVRANQVWMQHMNIAQTKGIPFRK